ncbi:hypothetical protein ACGIF2_09945 [Cellulomonas sp. P22]|uniref:hypothetical protein n=1 Tax=Cellulomonas sp. P22 TaxID=3373189 RepID=UPI0037B6B62F
MRRTAWLVLSPWLVVAAASGVAWVTLLVLEELWTTEDGGMGNLGGALLAVFVAALVWCGGSVALLYVVARRTFPAPFVRGAVGWSVVAAVAGSVPLGIATGLLDAAGVPFAAGIVPVCLPAAGTVTFLVTERRSTGRVVPPRVGRRRGVAAAVLFALAGVLVGATVGLVVDVGLLGPSQGELEAAAQGLVPPGYTAEEPVPINKTVLLTARGQSRALGVGGVEAMAAAAGWRTDDVERSPGATTLVLSRGDVQGRVLMEGNGTWAYSVTVSRRPVDGRGALVGGLLGAGAGAVGALVRRRERAAPTPNSRPGGP